MGEQKKDPGEEAAGKILTALLVVGAAWLLFQLAARGIFKLIMGGNSENGIYVLFYGGAIALLLIAVIGAGSGWALWRRSRPRPAAAPEPSAFSRGITLGLAAVALIALLLLAGFLRLLL